MNFPLLVALKQDNISF